MLIFIGILLFVLLVIVHEFGHFIAARKSGVEVEEFGLGFPPRAKTLTTKNGTEYTLNWLPLGGFVKLKGEHDAATEKGTFGAASFTKKTIIIAAGVIMNWLAAAVIFTVIALIGMPQLVENQFTVKNDSRVTQQAVQAALVEDDSPAAKGGVKQGDVILNIAGEKIYSATQLKTLTRKNAAKNVEVVFSRDDIKETIKVTLKEGESGNFGVAPLEKKLVRSTWSAPIVGIGTTAQFTIETFKGIFGALGNVFTGNASKAGESVTGPVGIVAVLNDLSKQGLVFVLFLIGVISVSLAVMNILPIPALDGGRLFVMALFRLIHKPLTKETEEKIHGTGMIVLLALAALITVVDVKRFF